MHIILLHGLGGSPNSALMTSLASHIRGLGHSVSCPFLPEHGAKGNPRIFTYTLSVQAIKSYILDISRKERCVIIGMSAGGVTGSRAVREIYNDGKGDNIVGLFLINTPANYSGDSMRRKYWLATLCQTLFGGIPYFFREKGGSFGLTWLRDFYHDARTYDIISDVTHIPCPKYVLGSTRDVMIPSDHQTTWSELADTMHFPYKDIRSPHSGKGYEQIIQTEIATFLKNI